VTLKSHSQRAAHPWQPKAYFITDTGVRAHPNMTIWGFEKVASAILRPYGIPLKRGYGEAPVNVLEGLQIIRGRLVENDADPATLTCVDTIIKRAALPAAQPATANSLVQLVRMLMRTPAADTNVRVYNDLVGLEDQLESAGVAFREKQALEDAKPVPKTKKFYKEQKEKQKKTADS
jgi:hypothetical protein